MNKDISNEQLKEELEKLCNINVRPLASKISKQLSGDVEKLIDLGFTENLGLGHEPNIVLSYTFTYLTSIIQFAENVKTSVLEEMESRTGVKFKQRLIDYGVV